MRKRIKLVAGIIAIVAIVLFYINRSVSITSIELSSPGNVAMNEAIKIVLDKEEKVLYVTKTAHLKIKNAPY